MDPKEWEFELTNEQLNEIEKLITNSKRDVPDFYEEGASEVLYVPVEGAELRVFHHKPEKQEAKRAILFIPGFGTTPWSWRAFHNPHHGIAEYYYLETREKRSCKIKRSRKADQ